MIINLMNYMLPEKTQAEHKEHGADTDESMQEKVWEEHFWVRS